MGKTIIVFTVEERKQYKEITYNKLLEGKYNIEIADFIGITESCVRKFIKELIEENRITKKEIDDIRKERKIREKKNDPRRKIILERLKRGDRARNIGKDNRVNLSKDGTQNIIKELISDR